jgi:hypothetical protein
MAPAPLVLLILPRLLDPLPLLNACAMLTFTEMPTPVHALLATTVVLLLLKLQQSLLPLPTAHALPTRTEMVPHALHALLTPPALAEATLPRQLL